MYVSTSSSYSSSSSSSRQPPRDPLLDDISSLAQEVINFASRQGEDITLESFLDPVSFNLMSDPVVLPSGKSCDRSTVEGIQYVIKDNGEVETFKRDPFSRDPIPMPLLSNQNLKNAIDQWKQNSSFSKTRLDQIIRKVREDKRQQLESEIRIKRKNDAVNATLEEIFSQQAQKETKENELFKRMQELMESFQQQNLLLQQQAANFRLPTSFTSSVSSTSSVPKALSSVNIQTIIEKESFNRMNKEQLENALIMAAKNGETSKVQAILACRQSYLISNEILGKAFIEAGMSNKFETMQVITHFDRFKSLSINDIRLGWLYREAKKQNNNPLMGVINNHFEELLTRQRGLENFFIKMLKEESVEILPLCIANIHFPEVSIDLLSQSFDLSAEKGDFIAMESVIGCSRFSEIPVVKSKGKDAPKYTLSSAFMKAAKNENLEGVQLIMNCGRFPEIPIQIIEKKLKNPQKSDINFIFLFMQCYRFKELSIDILKTVFNFAESCKHFDLMWLILTYEKFNEKDCPLEEELEMCGRAFVAALECNNIGFLNNIGQFRFFNQIVEKVVGSVIGRALYSKNFNMIRLIRNYNHFDELYYSGRLNNILINSFCEAARQNDIQGMQMIWDNGFGILPDVKNLATSAFFNNTLVSLVTNSNIPHIYISHYISHINQVGSFCEPEHRISEQGNREVLEFILTNFQLPEGILDRLFICAAEKNIFVMKLIGCSSRPVKILEEALRKAVENENEPGVEFISKSCSFKRISKECLEDIRKEYGYVCNEKITKLLEPDSFFKRMKKHF